jgi:hypothetical protein
MLDGLFFVQMREIGIHRDVVVNIEFVGWKGYQAVFVFPVAVIMGKTMVIRHLAQVFVPIPIGEETQTGIFRIIVPR